MALLQLLALGLVSAGLASTGALRVPVPDGARGSLLAPLSSGDVREVELAAAPGALVRHFRLDAPGAAPGAKPVGLARWLRADGGGGRTRLEVETWLPGAAARVLHVEVVGGGEQKLVWREVRERAGRTLLAVGDLAGELRIADTVGGEVRRVSIAAPRDAVFPLELLESVRTEAACAGPRALFEPLSGTVSEVELRLAPLPGPLPLRCARLVRADGTSGGVFLFAGTELILYRLQAGGPLATPIGAEEHGRLIEASSTRASIGTSLEAAEVVGSGDRG